MFTINHVIQFDPATVTLLTRWLDFLESKGNAQVQAKINEAVASLKKTDDVVETKLKENQT